MRLSDLLEEARADAPPMRLGVDDLVAAGRRRLRRRRAGWAMAAAVAVAAAIGAPQIATRPEIATRPQIVNQPQIVTSAFPEEKAATFSFTPTFRGYRVGGFIIEDPAAMTLGWTSAMINQGDQEEGILSVYPPGVERVRQEGVTMTPTDPVDGREAYLVREKSGGESLVWKLADGGQGQVSATAKLSRADMRRIAAAFRLGDGKPLLTTLTATHIPAGYRLFSASDTRMRFVTEAKAAEILASPDREHAPGVIKEMLSIRLESGTDGAFADSSEEPECSAGGPICTKGVLDGRWTVVVTGVGIELAEVKKVFESVEVADPEKPSAWTPVDEAYPTFVLPELN
ncbi:hypothetical protein ACTI_23290 [Actinoplanes sp. OR16]|uniref:hypothetical protein n=1 Tax=Actinoplanes sp. OR16 TaxID=946334 RepID=UPI000F6C5503|nr:hypothetical protein [Actinoplanes sp. OR16]BBH65644.1 hypothetical protein ACTI_23290 [Actinoplanes sp. OR16]